MSDEAADQMEDDQIEEMEDDDSSEVSDSSDDEDENMIAEESEENNEEENGKEVEQKKVFLPGTKMETGEQLVVDKSAYRILHQAQTGAPCLSFDIIKDTLGNSRETYPLTMYLVAGTQAPRAHVNNLLVMKMSNLQGFKSTENTEEESSESEDEDETNSPIMNVAPIKHQGCVNRIRCTQIGNTTLAACWSELGRITIWDLDYQLRALDNPAQLIQYRKQSEKSDQALKPLFSFKGHLSEGYGLDWCPTDLGTLASGDCKGNIHIWRCNNSGGNQFWNVDQRPYNSHAPHSVEDLQWSPNEKHVLASCSVDKR